MALVPKAATEALTALPAVIEKILRNLDNCWAENLKILAAIPTPPIDIINSLELLSEISLAESPAIKVTKTTCKAKRG